MNLQTSIRPELWLAVQSTYEVGNYSHAILDAMHYLTDVLRDKSGVDGDGPRLVGQALGGDPPRLRVTKLQTETERDIQNGLQDILRGLYRAIRNPRSHEQIEDSKSTADAIIYFIDYLLGILAKSRPPFTMDEFLAKVFDPDFVRSPSYAELLVAQIPESKRLDALIQIYRDRDSGDGQALHYIVGAVLEQLSEEQIESFFTVVSDELATARGERTFRVTLQMLPASEWPRVNKVARMRAEYKLMNSIREGSYDPFAKQIKELLALGQLILLNSSHARPK